MGRWCLRASPPLHLLVPRPTGHLLHLDFLFLYFFTSSTSPHGRPACCRQPTLVQRAGCFQVRLVDGRQLQAVLRFLLEYAHGHPPQLAVERKPCLTVSCGRATGAVINIESDADFQTRVLEASGTVPIIVDCYAECAALPRRLWACYLCSPVWWVVPASWCGPCRSLTPVLTEVVEAQGGKVILAKVRDAQMGCVSTCHPLNRARRGLGVGERGRCPRRGRPAHGELHSRRVRLLAEGGHQQVLTPTPPALLASPPAVC